MTYRPSKETRRKLRDLYEMKGSYQKVADELNKGRRSESKNFTTYQVRQMLNRKRIARGEYVDNPTPVRLSEAQKRSLQRKTKEEGAVYRKSYTEYRDNPKRSEKAYRDIKANIQKELDILKAKKREAVKSLDTALADEIQKDINKYNTFNDNLENAVDSADDYTDWRTIRDKVS
jgi:uncharacterized protein involved in exopolysaccharide biosynthesis